MKILTRRVSLQSSNSKFQKMAAILNFRIFRKLQNTEMLIFHKTVLDRVISTKFLTHRVSLQSSHLSKYFCLAKNGGHFELIVARNATQKNAYILKTMLDRADYADFGCHNSIRLEAEHYLNTLAVTVISFLGRFVFAVQTHSFFFASDPLVAFGSDFFFSLSLTE